MAVLDCAVLALSLQQGKWPFAGLHSTLGLLLFDGTWSADQLSHMKTRLQSVFNKFFFPETRLQSVSNTCFQRCRER